MKLFAIITILVLGIGFGFGQDLNDFTTLQAADYIPEDFTKRSTDKYETDLEANRNEELDKEFFLSTRFFIDELLLSGKVLFNEDLSNYVTKVARYILRTEKKLFKELRFYVLKSTTVNAFSTDQGIIIFTTGLLAQLENEAQLAYIIAHEVSHYTDHHVRDSYVEKQTLRRGRGKYQRLDYEDKISELSVYEKENELAADKKGIEIYLKSEYAIDEVFSSFEMLLYSYLPFNEVKFDPEFLNTEIMKIPTSFFPDTTKEITLEEDYDDRNSTHPNIKKRIDAAIDVVGNKSSRGDLKFKVSEENFYKVRNLARFEGMNLLLAEREYGKALYHAFLLNREFPDNKFVDLSFIKALYGLAKYKNASRYREVTEKPKKVEGESFPLHLFLYNLEREHINTIAYRHAYDMAKKYPKDDIFLRYANDLKKELATKSKLEYNELKNFPHDEYLSTLEEKVSEFDVKDSIARVDASDLSKYEKIKLKRKLRAMENDLEAPTDLESDFYKFAFYDLVANEHFIEDLAKLEKEYKELQEAKEQRSDEEKESLGINKILVVDPIFENYKLNRKKNLTKSEDQKVDLASIYIDDYPELNLKTDILDSKLLVKEGVDKYNDLGIISQWVQEVLGHEEIDMISSSNQNMRSIEKKYDTEHFLFTGVFAYKDRHEFSAAHLYGIIAVYTIPIVLIDLLVVHNNFEMIAFSVNSETDEIEFTTSNDVNLKGNPKIIEAYVYDILYQISNEKH